MQTESTEPVGYEPSLHPDQVVDAEVIGTAVDPYLAPLALRTEDIAVRATDDSSLMTREQYRALADRLIFDKDAWDQYFARCECVVKAGMYGHKNASTVAVAGLKGMSLGMSFMEAIDRIKVIHGTPVIRGSAAINHIHERCKGAKCRCITSTTTEAVWIMSRPGWEPKEFRFTWDDAIKAGLLKNEIYKLYPARCLKWQAASEGAQEMFGDVLSGLYFQEEIHDTPPPEKAYREPPSGTSSTGTGDNGTSSTGTVEPTEEHPKATKLKLLLETWARKRGATRKSVYDETLMLLGIKVGDGNTPTLPQMDRMIAHLESGLVE